jgi:hypothetical protein
MFGKKYSLKDPKGRKKKNRKRCMTEKRNQRELLWFQTEGAFNFITAAPHCGDCIEIKNVDTLNKTLSQCSDTRDELADKRFTQKDKQK